MRSSSATLLPSCGSGLVPEHPQLASTTSNSRQRIGRSLRVLVPWPSNRYHNAHPVSSSPQLFVIAEDHYHVTPPPCSGKLAALQGVWVGRVPPTPPVRLGSSLRSLVSVAARPRRLGSSLRSLVSVAARPRRLGSSLR